MARPREFEVEDAARGLLDVFWANGYEGTSMGDIEAATRLKKQSLYRVFANKRGMYLAALAAYDQDHVVAARDILRRAPDAAAGFATLLNAIVDSALATNNRRGCFLCDASVDQAPHDPETAAKVAAMVGQIESSFREALLADGIAKGVAQRLARKTLASYFGLRVLVKSGASEAVLRDVAEQMLEDLSGS